MGPTLLFVRCVLTTAQGSDSGQRNGRSGYRTPRRSGRSAVCAVLQAPRRQLPFCHRHYRYRIRFPQFESRTETTGQGQSVVLTPHICASLQIVSFVLPRLLSFARGRLVSERDRPDDFACSIWRRCRGIVKISCHTTQDWSQLLIRTCRTSEKNSSRSSVESLAPFWPAALTCPVM